MMRHAERLRAWSLPLRQAVVAAVFVVPAALLGPTAAADPLTTQDRGAVVSAVAVRPGRTSADVRPGRTERDHRPERRLGDLLAVEYAGAVPATQVRALVARVNLELRTHGSPREHLIRTTEAVCRRELTDHLARGHRLT